MNKYESYSLLLLFATYFKLIQYTREIYNMNILLLAH